MLFHLFEVENQCSCLFISNLVFFVVRILIRTPAPYYRLLPSQSPQISKPVSISSTFIDCATPSVSHWDSKSWCHLCVISLSYLLSSKPMARIVLTFKWLFSFLYSWFRLFSNQHFLNCIQENSAWENTV